MGNEDVDYIWPNDFCKRHKRDVYFNPVEKSTCSQETDGRPESDNKGVLSELWSYDLDSGRIVHTKSGLCLVASDKDGKFYFTPDYYTQLTLINCDHPFLWPTRSYQRLHSGLGREAAGASGGGTCTTCNLAPCSKYAGGAGGILTAPQILRGIIIWTIVIFPRACALMLGLILRRCTCGTAKKKTNNGVSASYDANLDWCLAACYVLA